MELIFSEVRFDNHKELMHHYLSENENPGTREDSGLLIACYQRLGNDLPDKLIGDFAFTVWDEEKRYYFCARDQLGKAAFYYTFLNGVFLQASSLTELFAFLPDKPRPNLDIMREYPYCRAYIDPNLTMYEGIYRLPPGHKMIVRGTQTEISRYWHPEKIEIDYDMTLEDASARFLELFEEAVSCRLDKNGKTGCEVSGGLDSSSVYCTARHLGANIEAYSLRFGEMSCDESEYIDDVLACAGERGVAVEVEKLDYQCRYSLKNNYIYSPHWPIWTTITFFLPILESMQKNGIKVALTGQGGDQLMTGSLYMPLDLLKRGEFRAFLKEFRVMGKAKKMVVKRFFKEILRMILPQSLFERLREKVLRLSRTSGAPPHRNCKKYTNLAHYADSFTQKQELSFITSAAHSMFADVSSYRIAKEHFGIEYHHPFFDIRLVEFMLSVPPEYKYSNRTFKLLLRKAMKGILPESVRKREDKAAFNEVIIQQIEAIDLDHFWRDAHIVRLGIITQPMIEKIYSVHKEEVWAYQQYWLLVNLEQWYRSNYDPERA